MFGKKGGLRRAWFGGLRRDDVEAAITRLEDHNRELEGRIVTSEETAREAVDRVQVAEHTVATFQATIQNIDALLTLANERARAIEEQAREDAARIRAEAEEQARETARQVEALEQRRQQVLDELAVLRAGLTTLAEAARPSPARVHQLRSRGPLHLPEAGAGA